MVLITITQNYIYLYILLFIINLYILIVYSKNFTQEGLIDYLIYLTTKIILFVMMISFLLISVVMLLGGSQTTTDYFINNLSSNILIYAFFNYGILYFIVFLDWLKEMFIKNDLYQYSFIKKTGEIKK